MRLMNVAVVNEVVCVTAAAAVESCPALLAVFLGVNVRTCKFLFQLFVESSLVDVAHFHILNANELVAGINVALGGDSYILVAAAAASQALDSARSLVKVEHKVEEVEVLALLVVDKEHLRELLILGENSREVALSDRVRLFRVAYARLNRDLIEALVEKAVNVVREVEIVLCECACRCRERSNSGGFSFQQALCTSA